MHSPVLATTSPRAPHYVLRATFGVCLMMFASASLAAEPRRNNTPDASLSQAYVAYRAGESLRARQLLVLTALEFKPLKPNQRLRYWRLWFELDREAERFQQAAVAGQNCRKYFDIMPSVDYADLAAFALHLSNVCQQLDPPADARAHLEWALSRWPHVSEVTAARRALIDPQGRFALARLRVAAALARLPNNSNAIVDDAADPWESILADARSWLADHASGHARADDWQACVELLVDGLRSRGQTQQAVDLLHELSGRSIRFRDPLDAPRWLGSLARQLEPLDSPHAAHVIDQALAAVAAVRPDATNAVAREQLVGDLAYDAARIHRALGDAARASQAIARARQAYQRLEANASDARDRIYYLARLGQLAELSGDMPAAIQLGQRLIDLQEEVLSPRDPRRLQARTAIASLCVAAGDVDAASRMLRAEDFEPVRAEQHLAPANFGAALLVWCQVCKLQGTYLTARQQLEQARGIWGRLPHDELLRIKLDAQLAEFLLAEGNYRQAIDVLEPLRKPLGAPVDGATEQAQRSALLAQVLLSLALVYDAQGHFSQSLSLCREACAKRFETLAPDAVEALSYHLALCRALLHQLTEGPQHEPPADIDQSIADAHRHIDLSYRIVTDSNRRDTLDGARVLYHRGLLHEYERDLSAALDDWKSALDITRQLNADPILQARLLVQIGRTLAAQLQYAAADPLLAEAVQLLEEIQALPGLCYAALCAHAQVLLALDRTTADNDQQAPSTREALALARLTRAVELMEFPRAASTSGETARAHFFARYAQAYDLLVDLYATRYDRDRRDADFERALYYADRSRNRTLLDQLATTENQYLLTLGPAATELQQQRDALLQECLEVEMQLLALRDRPVAGTVADPAEDLSTRRNKLQAQLSDRRAAYAQCHARLQDMLRQHVGAEAAFPTCEPHEWGAITRQVLQSGDAALVYHCSPHGSHLFLLTQQGGRHWRLRAETAHTDTNVSTPLTVTQLAQHVAEYRQIITDHSLSFTLCNATSPASAGDGRTGQVLQQSAHKVAQLLLPPTCREELSRLTHTDGVLIVVPDGPLQQLPLEALLWQPGNPATFAVDQMPPLVYTPSLTTLARIQARQSPAGSNKSPALISLGIDDFSYWRQSIPALANLPAARQESQDIAAAFQQAHPTGQVRTLLDADACESRLRAALAQFPTTHLHLATHAEIDQESYGLFGRILLAPDAATDSTESNAALDAYEVPTLPLGSCELVMLSGCNTNIGPRVPLECASSLLRAFLSAGAKRVLGSHWAVSDQPTAELMTHFVHGLSATSNSNRAEYARSLHAAREKVRAVYPSPYHWAPFVLYGPAR